MKNKTKKLSVFILSASLFIATTATPQYIARDFDDTLTQWFHDLGIYGKILDVQKNYDGDGYLDEFQFLYEEQRPPIENFLTIGEKDRTNPKLQIGLWQDQEKEYIKVGVLEKDIKSIPYMYFDWIAKLAIPIAIKKISSVLGLTYKKTKISSGNYRVLLTPQKGIPASDYRFDEVEVFYSIKNLIFSIDFTLKGPKGYKVSSFFRGYLNAILRTLENGEIPELSNLLASSLTDGKLDSEGLLKVLDLPGAVSDVSDAIEGEPGLIYDQELLNLNSSDQE